MAVTNLLNSERIWGVVVKFCTTYNELRWAQALDRRCLFTAKKLALCARLRCFRVVSWVDVSVSAFHTLSIRTDLLFSPNISFPFVFTLICISTFLYLHGILGFALWVSFALFATIFNFLLIFFRDINVVVVVVVVVASHCAAKSIWESYSLLF